MGLNRYEVGMGTDTCQIEAPTAGHAAMYYGLYLVNTNNPFMAAVYTENGAAWQGDAYWLNFTPDEAHVTMVARRLGEKPYFDNCRVIESEAPDEPTA